MGDSMLEAASSPTNVQLSNHAAAFRNTRAGVHDVCLVHSALLFWSLRLTSLAIFCLLERRIFPCIVESLRS